MGLGLTAAFLYAPSARAADEALVPLPAAIEPAPGVFRSAGPLTIRVPRGDAEAQRAADDLIELLSSAAPGGLLPLRLTGDPTAEGGVVLQRSTDATLGAEGYRLEVSAEHVVITASAPAGWFHGGITLWQLAQRVSGGGVVIAAQRITDRPRLAWRGAMLDSARHVQSPQFILQLIDWMALHKLNVLHWHLTDDQGWRIQILRYPALTSVGGFRIPAGAAAAGGPYGGFYTQAQIRAIVAHAQRRYVTLVPEIDLPGHASAALASYPALGVRPGLVPVVPSDWGVYPHAYSAQESTFVFLENVLREVMRLFPGPYVHIGGDEVAVDEWRSDPRTAARLRELGLASPEDLRHYFVARLQQFLARHGRRTVGWDEILTPALSRQAIVMSWRGTQGAQAAAAQGNDTVLSPDPQLYLDHRQGVGREEPPGRVTVISLRDVYQYEPVPASLPPAQRKHILGLQANLWTEHMRTEERVAAMGFPRLAALAEVGWTEPQRRDWPDFERRVAGMLDRYRQLGLPFDESLFGIVASVDYGADASTARVTLGRQGDYGVIRFTVDGTDPTGASPEYHSPLDLKPGSEVRAASFETQTRLSAVRRWQTFSGFIGRRRSDELTLCGSAVPLALEDDAPLHGERAVFAVDIEHPCWIWPDLDLDHLGTVVAAVGQVPFNFQIGADRDRIRFPIPQTPSGELEVHVDGCEGPLYGRLPLAPAAASPAVTVLPPLTVTPVSGVHDLCFRFAQHGVDPLWVVDWIELHTAVNSTQ